MYKFVCAVALLFTSFCAGAQAINNTWTYRDMPTPGFVRFQYENDFFTATDRFYTQGIHLELGAHWLRKLPTARLLVIPAADSMQYRVALQHNAYTPLSIQDSSIRYGDRPYASSFMMQFQSIATDNRRRRRIASTLSLGIMGRIAGGEWMQKAIHKALNNVTPRGWHHQVANDIVLNYRLQYEKNLLQAANYLSINAAASVDVGSLLTKASAGTNILLGYFNSPYGNRKSRTNIYIYTQPQVHAVGYDATLQGGLFSNSPYTIPASKINRVVIDNRYGIVIRLGSVYLEYFRYNIGKEFSGGLRHAWGGVQMGVAF